MVKGTGVSQGIGIGKAFLITESEIAIPEHKIEDTAQETARYQQAVQDFISLTEEKSGGLGGNEAEILMAHCALAGDPELNDTVAATITSEQINAAKAAELVFNQFIEVFAAMEDTLLAERALDLKDIKDKILRILLQLPIQDYSNLPADSVLVAEELTPSITAVIDPEKVSGFVTASGGSMSHTAIIARSLEIPAVVGVTNILAEIKAGDQVIVDGSNGEVQICPDEKVVADYREKQVNHLAYREELKQYIGKETKTKDKITVALCANIGGPADIQRVLDNDGEGVGLFRSEFLYMEQDSLPTEEAQDQAYREVAQALSGKPVILRTLDVGGDKDIPYLKLVREENPFLGFRAVRHSLKYPEIFMQQVRAALRASHYGEIQIMIPMITDVQEFKKALAIIEAAKAQLKEEQVPFNDSIKVGMMIETPAAAVNADALAKYADFFSIGTNDLTQYTIAVDRGNEQVADLYTHYHPAVMRLIKGTIEAAKRHHIPVGMCGEAAADPKFIPFLLWAGIDELSVGTAALLETRKKISELTIGEVQDQIEEMCKLESADEVEVFLESHFQ